MTAADLEQVIEIAASLPDAPHWPQSAYVNALNPDCHPSPHRPRRRPRRSRSDSPATFIGFAVASLLPPQAELETIAVAAASQRRGLGRRLFDALASELKPRASA